VWMRGPFKASMHDINIFRGDDGTGEPGLRDRVPPGKKGIGDSGYVGERPTYMTTPNTHDPKELRLFKGRARARQECFNAGEEEKIHRAFESKRGEENGEAAAEEEEEEVVTPSRGASDADRFRQRPSRRRGIVIFMVVDVSSSCRHIIVSTIFPLSSNFSTFIILMLLSRWQFQHLDVLHLVSTFDDSTFYFQRFFGD